jgi:aminoglycoside 6'-N-acetyltransferase I
VEGWYVDGDLRGGGYGRQLIQAAERWAIEHGFDELASDAELGNMDSIAAHQAVGFEEVERLVCFIKKLG